MIKLTELLDEAESFIDIFGVKNRWMKLLKKNEKEELKKNLYVLINNAYAPLGGHVRVSDVNKVLDPKLTYWEAIDISGDPDADAVLFGKKMKSGVKISGFGHDGQKKSKSELVKKMADQLKKKGYWLEASDAPAKIMLGKGVPYVDSKEKIDKLYNTDVEWLDNKGWYIRTVNSQGLKSKEITLGKPLGI